MAKKTVVRSMRILMRALVVTVGLYLTVNAAVLFKVDPIIKTA